MTRGPDTGTYAAFAGAILIGGANFIAVSISNRELPPLWGATLRFATAGALFLALARLRRVPLARGREALGAALYGVLGFGAAYAFLYYALVELSAGTAAVILAAVPLITLLLAAVFGQERLSVRGLVGGALAVGGIAVLSLDSIEADIPPRYLVASVLGTIAVAASSVIARSLRAVHPLNMNAIGMVAGTVVLIAGSLLLGEPRPMPERAATWVAFGWLVTLGSVGLFQLFLHVLQRWTASATVYALTGMPVVAVALGTIFLDEPVTLEVVAGGALVIGAVYVGAISRERTHPAPLPECPEPEAVDEAGGRRHGRGEDDGEALHSPHA